MTNHPAPFYADEHVTIHHGNALALPLADASVDLIVTSPPYFGLRSYQDSGQHYEGQIGSEATATEFTDALISATAEMARVLKPSGSIFVNLGDRYAGVGGPNNSGAAVGETARKVARSQGQLYSKGAREGAPSKSLMLLPERYRIRAVDDLGLIARAVIIWDKPNGMPESVTDRVRRSHEDWVHLTKEPRYFSAVDEIRETHDQRYAQRRFTPAPLRAQRNTDREGGWTGALRDEKQVTGHPLGKLPGSVWEIPTQPLQVPDHLGVDHFAAFPLEWPRRIIRGWSPAGVCGECGEGRRPVSSTVREPDRPGRVQGRAVDALLGAHGPDGRAGSRVSSVRTITNYVCACPEPTAPTRPAVVLDPFMGTGTTLLAAKALGRRVVGVDLSRDYCRLAQWRCTDPGELAKAMQVEKPAPPPEGMDSLLDMLGMP